MERSRIRFIGVLATSAALVAALSGAATVSAAPIEYLSVPLFAGQTTDVGDVEVWNDADTYFVDIHIAAGWCMTETHIAAAASPGAIPQANGNPIPGKFPYGETYKSCITYDVFEIPVGSLGADPYFAVHVKVWEKVTSTAVIVSNAGPSNPVSVASTYPTFGAPVDAVVSSFGGWPAIPGASYISNQAAGDPFDVNMWRRATETLSVPGWPLGGELWVNSDNYEFTKLNGHEIERDQDAGATVEGTAPEPAGVSPQTWQTIKHVSFKPKMGANSFEFVYRNATWGGNSGFTDNPTGLAYKAKACYYAHSETAWAGKTPFPGKNWATYFQYHFVEPT